MRSLFNKRTSTSGPVLTADANGFGSEGEAVWRASWSDLDRISVYKVDLFTVDEIRVVFEMHDGATHTVTEESSGFEALMIELVRRFPSVTGWHGKVAQPPFAAQLIVLYEVETAK